MGNQEKDFDCIARLSKALDDDITVREEAEMAEFNMRKVLTQELFSRGFYGLITLDIMRLKDIADSNSIPSDLEDFMIMMMDEVLHVNESDVKSYLTSVRNLNGKKFEGRVLVDID